MSIKLDSEGEQRVKKQHSPLDRRRPGIEKKTELGNKSDLIYRKIPTLSLRFFKKPTIKPLSPFLFRPYLNPCHIYILFRFYLHFFIYFLYIFLQVHKHNMLSRADLFPQECLPALFRQPQSRRKSLELFHRQH